MNISGFTVTGAIYGDKTAGIYLGAGVTLCNISNNILTGNVNGIELSIGSHNNTFTSNNASSNLYQGFELWNSDYNTFTSNTANLNNSTTGSGYGFKVNSSSHNTWTGNTANSNIRNGFFLATASSEPGVDPTGCNYNTFTNNTANSNGQYGIRMDNGDHNTLTGNTFKANAVAAFNMKFAITYLTVDSNNITGSPIGINIASDITAPVVTTWAVTHNNIWGNTTYGVSNGGTGTLIATNNWWNNTTNYTGSVTILTYYKANDTVTITIQNAYKSGLGDLRVTAKSTLTDPTTIDIYCTETGTGTGTFTGSFQLVSGTAGSGQLRANNEDTITVSYAGDWGTVVGSATVTTTAVYDSAAPTVILSAATTDPINAPIAVTAEFIEPVTGFVKGDITVSSGSSVGSFVAVSTTVYTFSVTPTVDGLVTVNIPAGRCIDRAGNANTAATPLTRTYDGTAPTVELSAAAQDPTKASPIAVTATFSEAVIGFAAGDIDVTNGTAGNLVSSADTIFTFDVTPTPNLLVTVAIRDGKCTDLAGNANTEADPPLTRTSDLIPPTVAITSTIGSTGSTTDVTPVPFTAIFSEAVTGFVLGDITVTNGTAGCFVAVSPAVYNFCVTPTAAGAVTVSIPVKKAKDLATNDNSISTPSPFTFTFVNTRPTTTISAPGVTSPWKTSPIPFRVIFNADVTGFVVGDITLTNGSVATGSFSAVSARVYNFSVTPTGQGAVTVCIAAGVCIDASSRPNLAATCCTIIYDSVVPTVAITCNTGASHWVYTFTWSEVITDFEIDCITVTNGTPGAFAGTDRVFTLEVTPPTIDGTVVTVTVAAGCVTDGAGNTNAEATHELTYRIGTGTSAIIYLNTGWNLISLPLIPDSTAIATVLAGITPTGKVISVWSYNPLATDKWPSYTPSGPPGLLTMEDGKGYLINMSVPATLVVSGTVLPVGPLTLPPTYDVSIGYNLVGFKSLAAMENGDYLSPLSYRFPIYWKQAGVWQELDATGEDMTPGFGYWVYFNAAGTITPP
ncbi:MAG: Ig-like domain-containing protein [Chloroflexi bacterium]|nr:Ig-like domain-containing protein [Chloroflexota bacterium]